MRRPVSPSGRSLEAAGDRRPREMITGNLLRVSYRIRLTGPLQFTLSPKFTFPFVSYFFISYVATMYDHAPESYPCPFCLLLRGVENEHVLSRRTDVILQTVWVTAFISSHQFPGTPGHVLVIPNAHHENLYDLPLHLAVQIHEATRAVALAMKSAYGCEGISTRQHNEPAGNQDVWHYHMHVFPRYAGDGLYGSKRVFMPEDTRANYANQLRAALAGSHTP